MIGEEGINVDCTGATGNLTDFAFDDCQFQDAFRRGFKFDLRVWIALSDILGNNIPVQLVDAVLIDTFGEIGFNLFGIDKGNAGKLDTGVIQAFGIVFRRHLLCNRVIILLFLQIPCRLLAFLDFDRMNLVEIVAEVFVELVGYVFIDLIEGIRRIGRIGV